MYILYYGLVVYHCSWISYHFLCYFWLNLVGFGRLFFFFLQGFLLGWLSFMVFLAELGGGFFVRVTRDTVWRIGLWMAWNGLDSFEGGC
jgi:hypothetical protein